MLKVAGSYLTSPLTSIKCLENRDKFDSVLTRVKVWIKAIIVFDLDFSMPRVEE